MTGRLDELNAQIQNNKLGIHRLKRLQMDDSQKSKNIALKVAQSKRKIQNHDEEIRLAQATLESVLGR